MKRASRRPRTRWEGGGAAPAEPRQHEARIYSPLKDNGSSYWTLFDSGARRTYVSRPAAARMGMKRLAKPIRCALGGRVHAVTHVCTVVGTVEGRGITADALVVDRLFADERGRTVDILLGMETMETWGIGLDTFHKRLDFTYYAREVVEG